MTGAKLGVLEMFIVLMVSSYSVIRCATGGRPCDLVIPYAGLALSTITAMGLAVYYFRVTSTRSREKSSKRLPSFNKGASIDLDKLKAMAKPSQKPTSEEEKQKEQKRKEEQEKILEGLKQRPIHESA